MQRGRTHPAKLAWFIWGIGAFFFFAEYFVRISPSVATQQLMSSFHVNAFALGGLSASFYYAYISMQIPVGLLVDHFGPKRVMFCATLICALGSALFAMATDIYIADISRFMIGFAAAFAFVGTLKLVSVWFEPKYFAFLAGATQGLGMLGACIGDAPMAVLFHAFGWRTSMFGIAVIFGLVSLLILFLMKDRPDHIKVIHHAERPPFWPGLWTVMKNGQSWWNCLYVGLNFGPTAAFAGLWGVSYIREAYHVSNTLAAGMVGMIFIGMAIGCPIFGWISDSTRKRLPLMRLSAICSLLLISTIVYAPYIGIHLGETSLFIVLFAYGILNGGLVPSYALGADVNLHRLTGLAMGVTNMASVIIGATLIPIIGKLLVINWSGVMIDNAPHYSAQNYQFALMTLPACFILAMMATFFIRETHCKPRREA